MNFFRKKAIPTTPFGCRKDAEPDLSRIQNYFLHKTHTNAAHILSDRTCNDLDLQALFAFLDRTNSVIGQQYLYDTLRAFRTAENRHIDEKFIEKLTNDETLRNTLHRQLSTLNRFETFYLSSLFQEPLAQPPKWFFVVKLLSFATTLSLVLLFINPSLTTVFVSLIIMNFGVHYWNKRNLFRYSESLPELIKMIQIARRLSKNNASLPPNSNELQSIQQLEKLQKKMRYFSFESRMQSDIAMLIWALFEIVKIIFLIEPLLLFTILKQLQTKTNAIENVFQFVGKVDMHYSIASLRHGLPNWCKPTNITINKTLKTKGLYHPLIVNCIKNNIDINGKSVLLTGSNMSGKTTFIRTIGINIITSYALNTAFAETFSIRFMPLFSAIRVSDDLLNDKSYYFEEVLTIKSMLHQSESTQPTIFLLDEIFKGTNTIERIAAGKAVLSYLNRNDNIVFVSTHDIELADLLKDEYDLYHFSETVDDKNIDFDYTLKPGKLRRRNAIKILEINSYPSEIVQEALYLSKQINQLPTRTEKNRTQ